MNRKKILTVAVLTIIAVGFIASLIPFSGSMKPSAKADNAATLRIPINEMKVGSVKHIKEAYYLYKKSEDSFHLMNGWAPRRGCDIKYIKAGEHNYTWGEAVHYSSKPHFYEGCDGAVWDLTGTLVKGTGHYEEKNMEQRSYEVSGEKYILFHTGKG
jgi:hypothetical protein